MEYFIGVYKKYADFTGRARRKEYWMFYLLYIVAYILLSFLDGALGLYSPQSGTGILSTLFVIGSIIPSLAVATRRLHDTQRSGWWLLLLFIPILGALIVLFFLVLRGDRGENRFGSDPLEGAIS